jgi:hypothetical protein
MVASRAVFWLQIRQTLFQVEVFLFKRKNVKKKDGKDDNFDGEYSQDYETFYYRSDPNNHHLLPNRNDLSRPNDVAQVSISQTFNKLQIFTSENNISRFFTYLHFRFVLFWCKSWFSNSL